MTVLALAQQTIGDAKKKKKKALSFFRDTTVRPVISCIQAEVLFAVGPLQLALQKAVCKNDLKTIAGSKFNTKQL